MRIGLLSASRISVNALIKPAEGLESAELAAVGARDLGTAERFAATHSIPASYGSYAELLADDSLDAIYVSNPASLHAEWSIAALESGKHVLCEKPFAGNAADARLMVEAAERQGKTLLEAFHWRFHPLADEMISLVNRLTRPIHIESAFNIPQIPKTDIRYQYELGGGALMDLGCYPLHWIRTLLGEPDEIEASMESTVAGVDDTTNATLRFPDESTAHLSTSMAAKDFEAWLVARGGNGWVEIDNPLAPHTGNELRWNIEDEEGTAVVEGSTTYRHQLEGFIAAVAGANQVVTGEDSIGNMAAIDRMYLSAGFDRRP